MKGTPQADISRTLDHLHAAASAADFDTYFALFTQDAIFIGTDPKERWTLDQFKAYTKPYFSEGKGWTYLPKERHVILSKYADLAWFDELLWNEKYRFCRGSGVVRKGSDGDWRVEQYVLSFAIANEVAKEATNITK